MSALDSITIQDVSQDPGTHPIGNRDQNNNNNNFNTNQYVSNRLQPSFINNNFPSQTSTHLHHDYIGNSLNQHILLPETCHIATQNIRGGLSHLSKQIAILSLLTNPPPSTTRINIFGLTHTGLTVKQAKFALLTISSQIINPFSPVLPTIIFTQEWVYFFTTVLRYTFKKLAVYLDKYCISIYTSKAKLNCESFKHTFHLSIQTTKKPSKKSNRFYQIRFQKLFATK